MGKMNILKAGFTGKVGVTYGTETKGKQVLRVIPFSHTPHNEAQKNAFSAFSCLQRFASPVARYFFQYLPLEAKHMTKLNAVASWLKPLIARGAFNPQEIKSLAQEENAITLDSCVYDTDMKQFVITVTINPVALEYENLHLHLQCFDDTGKVWATWDSVAEDGMFRTFTLWQETPAVRCVALLAGKKSGKKYFVGADFCPVSVPTD